MSKWLWKLCFIDSQPKGANKLSYKHSHTFILLIGSAGSINNKFCGAFIMDN